MWKFFTFKWCRYTKASSVSTGLGFHSNWYDVLLQFYLWSHSVSLIKLRYRFSICPRFRLLLWGEWNFETFQQFKAWRHKWTSIFVFVCYLWLVIKKRVQYIMNHYHYDLFFLKKSQQSLTFTTFWQPCHIFQNLSMCYNKKSHKISRIFTIWGTISLLVLVKFFWQTDDNFILLSDWKWKVFKKLK